MSSTADGLRLNTTRFDTALVRLVSTSKKAAVDVMKQQAKLLFVDVAKVTPPASPNTFGRKAEAQGKAAVARDIYSLYGTPSDAYDAITAGSTPEQADVFWFLTESGMTQDAAQILSSATGGKGMHSFDGGALHSRTAGGSKRRNRGARGRREHVFYVTDPAALKAYVTEQQGHVWWLASGWADALTALGAPLPYGIGKHGGAPGRLKVVATSERIEITMINEVAYGRQVSDIERRVQWALNKRTIALDRAWNFYLDRAGRQAGFHVR